MHREIIEKLLAKGFSDAADAERALRATLAALGERLTFDEARSLALALPGDATLFWQESSYDADFDVAELYERVRRREGISLGRARERVQIVLAVLGSLLPEETKKLLERKLPAEVFALFDERAESAPPAHRVHGHTLATGRGGSSHPVSEAAPRRAHSESVALSRNPHGDTKLSSARGLTQERLDETLATGRH